MMKLYGGIEAGGTKFVCGIGTGPEDLQIHSFPTEEPQATIDQAIQFFRTHAGPALQAIGIGSFGPLDLDRRSPTYGSITSTPKLAWQHVDLAGTVADALQVPVGLDTDVNAAALAEGRWGAAREVDDFLYLTIGTGIGGGAVVGTRLIHGLMHPEMGHIRIPHDFATDPFPGNCPFHRDCLEGLASGVAMEARWRVPAEELPAGHPAWSLEAQYLALALSTWVCTLSPQRIVMGGGVMQQAFLFPMIQDRLRDLLNGYIPQRALREELAQYVVPPRLGYQAGVLGALLLGKQAANSA
jgi:fructokinase